MIYGVGGHSLREINPLTEALHSGSILLLMTKNLLNGMISVLKHCSFHIGMLTCKYLSKQSIKILEEKKYKTKNNKYIKK